MLGRLTLVVLTLAPTAIGQFREPSPKPAVSYVLDALDSYPIVAVSEWHGSRETKEFMAAVIRHPSFVSKATDIVVEFGNARHQSVMDRFVAGEDVPDDELRLVWENTTQVSGVWSASIYRDFFADVRAVNAEVPAASRFRVLLGDPPIDWKGVTGPADEDMNDWRDAHFAWVVEHKVVRRRRKALLFIGGAHLDRKVLLPNSLVHLLDERFTGRTLVVSTGDPGRIKPELVARMSAWPTPSVVDLRGTWLGAADVAEVGSFLSKGQVEDAYDAFLFLSRSAFSNVQPNIDPESPYGIELQRRRKLQEATVPFRGGGIRFAHGSIATAGESISALGIVLAELERDPGLKLVVKGHADSTETDAVQLSWERAKFLVDWLVRKGVERGRLMRMGCGATRPLWYSDTERHRAANRRAELVRRTKRSGCQPPESFDWE